MALISIVWWLYFIVLPIAIITASGLVIASWWHLFLGNKVPSTASHRHAIIAIGKLVKLTSEDRIADLGCGTGKFSSALIKKYGCSIRGYESSREAWIWAWWRSLWSRGKFSVRHQDFFKADLSPYNILYIYQLPDHMPRIEEWLKKYRGTDKKVICNSFPLPTTTPDKTVEFEGMRWEKKIYLYVF